MNLDFSALSGALQTQTKPEPRGQAGTVGTPTIMRGSLSATTGDQSGTSGDRSAPTSSYSSLPAHVGDAGQPAECPHESPPSPLTPTAGKPNEIMTSPWSPLVPAITGIDADRNECARESFEERAAIMEYDGGLSRAQAELAASAQRDLIA